MKATAALHHKIMTLPQLLQQAAAWRVNGKTIAFTNGCFDILHEGHVFSFEQAAATADYLVVGLNSDASVKRLKGPERPINRETSRALLISQLALVDAVVLFGEDTPFALIEALAPDVLVKGGDYRLDQIVGADVVMAKGGKVIINPLVAGFSTTGLIEKIKKGYS